jgi:hypothetical protein
MSIEVNSALFRSISFFKGDMAGQLIKTFKKKAHTIVAGMSFILQSSAKVDDCFTRAKICHNLDNVKLREGLNSEWNDMIQGDGIESK